MPVDALLGQFWGEVVLTKLRRGQKLPGSQLSGRINPLTSNPRGRGGAKATVAVVDQRARHEVSLRGLASDDVATEIVPEDFPHMAVRHDLSVNRPLAGNQ